ncbi:MAG: sterol-4-alpha-carboxylate 3-dehydrogenase, partial [Candidatus Sericytochromatia bacterium]
GLKTVMLRPRAIIGAGDTVIMPRLLRAHREGRLRIIGDGRNLVDMTAVKNVLHAVDLGLAAEGEALGQAYNITSGDPVRLWDTVGEVLKRLDLRLNRSKIPFVLAYSIAGAMEVAAKADPKQPEPSLTRYSVIMLARSQTLNINKARRLLGYAPVQTTNEAMDEFIEWWKKQHWIS